MHATIHAPQGTITLKKVAHLAPSGSPWRYVVQMAYTDEPEEVLHTPFVSKATAIKFAGILARLA